MFVFDGGESRLSNHINIVQTMNKILLSAGIFILTLAFNYSFAQTTVTSTTTKKVVTPRKTVTTTKTVTPAVKKPGVEEIAAGKELVAKSDCLACHKIDMKLVGPAYLDVAKKYPASEANYDLLSKKVIAGGSGNWGAVAMAPHANIPPADVKKMVEYILSLK